MVTTWLMMVGMAKVATARGTGISSNKFFSDCSSTDIRLFSQDKTSASPVPAGNRGGRSCRDLVVGEDFAQPLVVGGNPPAAGPKAVGHAVQLEPLHGDARLLRGIGIG